MPPHHIKVGVLGWGARLGGATDVVQGVIGEYAAGDTGRTKAAGLVAQPLNADAELACGISKAKGVAMDVDKGAP